MSKRSYSFAIIMACMCSPLHAEIYKWVDENGQTHYSDHAPMQTEVETMDIQPHYPSESTSSRPYTSNNSAVNVPSNSSSKQEKQPSYMTQSDEEYNKERCQRYTDRYKKYLREGVMGYNVLTGQTQKMTGQAARDAIQNTKEIMELYCK